MSEDVVNCSQPGCLNDCDRDAARLGEDHRDAWIVVDGLPVCCDCKDDLLSDPWPGERDD
jgi:hypothetical protein